MSYLTQMAGLAYHNFVSAAVGIALGYRFHPGHCSHREEDYRKFLGRFDARHVVASARCVSVRPDPGFARSRTEPQSLRLGEIDRAATCAENWPDGQPVLGPDGQPVIDTVTDQTIAQGPAASQEAIKMLGTNGGGFFNANSAHPFENPTPLSNYLQILSIFAIPAGLTHTLGA